MTPNSNSKVEGQPDCSNHQKDLFGQTDMKVVAEAIANMDYRPQVQLLAELSRKINADAENDYLAGREKLAAALQYTGMSLFESALRMEKVWKVCEPFMPASTPPVNEKQVSGNYEGGWFYEPDWLRQLTEKVNSLENGDGVDMEEVEAVLIAIGYQNNTVATPPVNTNERLFTLDEMRTGFYAARKRDSFDGTYEYAVFADYIKEQNE